MHRGGMNHILLNVIIVLMHITEWDNTGHLVINKILLVLLLWDNMLEAPRGQEEPFVKLDVK